MKLVVCMICLNNEQTIRPCVESLGFADQVVIVDGGSTDETLEYLVGVQEEFNITLVERRWHHHFGKQRQKSFQYAPLGEEWFWIRVDSDEIIPPLFRDNIRRLLEGLPPRIMAARIKQYNLVDGGYAANLGGWETWPRIWRADRRLEWVGQVHENVVRRLGEKLGMEQIPEREIASVNLGIIHQGWLWRDALEAKELQYMGMSGSGFEKRGDLTDRHYEVRRLPRCLDLNFG